MELLLQPRHTIITRTIPLTLTRSTSEHINRLPFGQVHQLFLVYVHPLSSLGDDPRVVIRNLTLPDSSRNALSDSASAFTSLAVRINSSKPANEAPTTGADGNTTRIR